MGVDFNSFADTRVYENKNKRTDFGCNFTFSLRKNVLSQVAEQGDEVIFAFLRASAKFDVESKDKDSGQTLLSYGAATWHEAVVKLPLEKGA